MGETLQSENSDTRKTRAPRLVVFDLDGTLWYPDLYKLRGWINYSTGAVEWKENGGSPFTKVDENTYRDTAGNEVSLFESTREILTALSIEDEKERICIAYASACDEPLWAKELLHAFQVQRGMSMFDVASFIEIYKGDKKSHFRKIMQEGSFQPSQILFFDNQMNNIESVSSLGVQCIYCPNGINLEVWNTGLKKFAGE